MKNQTTLLYLFSMLLVIASSSYAQNGWFKSYDISSSFHFSANNVTPTPDGGYAIVGSYRLSANPTEGLVVKTDDRGEVQWLRSFDNYTSYEACSQAIVRPDGKLVVVVNGPEPLLFLMDMAGNILVQGDGHPGIASPDEVILTSTGDYVCAGVEYTTSPQGFSNTNAMFAFYDSDMNFASDHTWDNIPYSDEERGLSVVQMDNGDFALLRMSGLNPPPPTDSIYLDRLDSNGNVVWSFYVEEFYYTFHFSGKMVKTEDGNLMAGYLLTPNSFRLTKVTPSGNILWKKSILASGGEKVLSFQATSDGGFVRVGELFDDVVLTKLDSVGGQVWRRVLKIPGSNIFFYLKVEETPDQGFIISGTHELTVGGARRMFLLKTDANGQFLTSLIEGSLKRDENGNCIAEANEPPLKNWVVEVQGEFHTFYATTDSLGFYTVPVYQGNYTIKFRHPNSPFWEICTDSSFVQVPNSGDIIVQDMAATPLFDCPLMDIDISSNWLRPCFENTYNVHYCNYGTATANNVSIDVQLDSFLQPISASEPFTWSGDNMHFELGDVPVDACGSISIKTELFCEPTIAGTLHCSKAMIEPAVFCGQGNLPSGISFSDEDCRNSTAAFDPNDKSASPLGVGPFREVPADTTLSYLIRFQNTGTDTAFNVVLIDTLSPNLDLSTLRPGSSSHPYKWEIYEQGILRFTFNDILLPDSTTNEVASHGFIAYEIQPRTGILPGQVIENKAGIIFDFNAPIITNTVIHTIAKPVHISNQYLTLCQGEIYNGWSVSSDTIVFDTIAFVEYDSVTITHITGLPNYFQSLQATICEGEVYPFHNEILMAPGTFQTVFTASNGCDSIISLTLDVFPVSTHQMTVEICSGATYPFDGQDLTAAGTYEATFTGVSGCDSIVTLSLEELEDQHTSIAAEICSGETYPFDGHDLMAAGTYEASLIAVNGCDSIVTLDLGVSPTYQVQVSASICSGESYQYNGEMLTQGGMYEWALTTSAGCDSTVILDLEILPEIQVDLSAEICDGSSYLFAGEALTHSGIYEAVFIASNGCDSTVTLELKVWPKHGSSFSAQICEGETYIFNGQMLDQAGMYEAFFQTINGCDSVITLSLEVLPTLEETLNVSICAGEKYSFNGEDLTEAGQYDATLTAANGCDSMVFLNLEVTDLLQAQLHKAICAGEVYNFYGQPLSHPGIYTETIQNAGTCDSIVTLTLEVLPHSEAQEEAVICEGGSYFFFGETLYKAGVYEAQIMAINGCDSTISLTLETLPTYETDTLLELQIGESYKGILITGDTSFIESLTAVNGCDSIVHVTITALTSTKDPVQQSIVMSLFPNPTLADFWLRVHLKQPEAVTIRVFNMMGQEMTATIEKQFVRSGFHGQKFDSTNWAAGVYFVCLYTEQVWLVERMVKH